jgi:hypothetical protein
MCARERKRERERKTFHARTANLTLAPKHAGDGSTMRPFFVNVHHGEFPNLQSSYTSSSTDLKSGGMATSRSKRKSAKLLRKRTKQSRWVVCVLLRVKQISPYDTDDLNSNHHEWWVHTHRNSVMKYSIWIVHVKKPRRKRPWQHQHCALRWSLWQHPLNPTADILSPPPPYTLSLLVTLYHERVITFSLPDRR